MDKSPLHVEDLTLRTNFDDDYIDATLFCQLALENLTPQAADVSVEYALFNGEKMLHQGNINHLNVNQQLDAGFAIHVKAP